MNRRMVGGSRMVGGAETATLTLDDGESGAVGPGGEKFVGPTSTPAKLIGIKPTFTAIKTVIDTYNALPNPNKKDLRLAASELFDSYNYSTPQARGILDQSIPLNGFVEELGHGVKLSPANARVFFNSLINLITEMVPNLSAPQSALGAQTQAPSLQGTGRGGSCGCCSTCGGAKKADDKKPDEPTGALGAPGDKPSKLTAGVTGNSIVNNVLNWIKQKREAAGTTVTEIKPAEKLEELAKKPPTGSAKPVSVKETEDRLKRFLKRGGAYGLPKKELMPKLRTQKSILPGRVLKLRAKIAQKQEELSSDDGAHSESDEEAVGRGMKRPNKRSLVVKRIMKQRGVSMIEASKIVKAEGLY